MPQSLLSVIVLLSWLALPVGLVCIVDDWFLRPRRLIAAAAPPHDSPLMTFLYSALPVLIAAAVLRLLIAERLDFSAVLLAITVLKSNRSATSRRSTAQAISTGSAL